MSNTKLNAIALYANFIVFALLGLLINPFLVRALGSEHFGLWKGLLRILDLSSVADGRATQALKWVVAHESANDGVEKKRRDVGAAILIWLVWLPFLATAVGASVIALPWLIHGISDEDLGMVRFAAGLVGFNVVITALVGIPDAVLVGTNQGFRSFVVTTFFLVVSNVGMLVAANAGFGLPGMGTTIVICTLLTGLTTLFIARRYVNWWGIRRPLREDVKRLFGFSNWTLAWAFIQMLMMSSEVLLIGYFSGATDISCYTFTSFVVQFGLSICLMTGSAVTPRLGALVGGRKTADAARLTSQTRQIVLVFIAVAGAGIILSNRAFLARWIGLDFYLGDAANVAMAAAFAQLALIRFDAQVQDVGLRIAPKVIVGAICAVLALALGAALFWATQSIAMIFVGLVIGRLPLHYFFPLFVERMIPGLNRGLGSIAGCITILACAYALSLVYSGESWLDLITLLIISIAFSVFASFFVILDGDMRSMVLRTLLKRPL